MSIGRIMTLAEKLSADDQALVAGFILAMSSRGNVQSSPITSTEAAKPVSKTTAWRMKKAAGSVPNGSTSVPNGSTSVPNGSTSVPNGSTSVPNAFQNVPSGTAETFHGTENGTGGTFHGTQRADVRALSSASSSEKTAEKKSTGAGEREGGTESGTIGGTESGTIGGTESGTIGGTQRGTRDGTAGGTLTAKAEAVRVALVEGFKRNGVAVPARHLSVPHSQPVIDIARSVEPADLPRLIEGFFADDGARAKGYPVAWLANNPAQYMPKPSANAAPSTAGRPSTLTEHEHHALNREEQIKRGERVRPPNPDDLKSAKAKMAAAQQAMAS